MLQFLRQSDPSLFVADGLTAGGWAGLVLPQPAPALQSIGLDQALTDAKLKASFVLSSKTPDITGGGAAALVQRVREVVKTFKFNDRAFVWLREGTSADKTPAMPLVVQNGVAQTDEKLRNDQLTAKNGLGVFLDKGLQIEVAKDGRGLVFNTSKGAGAVGFSGAKLLKPYAPVKSVALAMAGDTAGCLIFDLRFKRSDLYDVLYWGFQFAIQGPSVPNPVTPIWYPLAERNGPNPSDALGFNASIDPSDPVNEFHAGRTAFWFDGTTIVNGQGSPQKPTVLQSYYRTATGKRVDLLPLARSTATSVGGQGAYLEVREGVATAVGSSELFQLSPVGDFALKLRDKSEAVSVRLLCGLNGTESIELLAGAAVDKGDRLRFVSRKPAYVPVWPVPTASPLNPPTTVGASPLDTQFRTSWVTVVRGTGGAPLYAAQPPGAPLFGKNGQANVGAAALLDPFAGGTAWPEVTDLAVPMLPYVGVKPGDGAVAMSADQVGQLEHDVLAPYRGQLLREAAARAPRAASAALDGPGEPTTTPDGIIVHARKDGSYSDILLGWTASPSGGPAAGLSMRFSDPPEELQKAFQTGSLFLVVANSRKLGKLVDYDDQNKGKTPPAGTPAFWDALSIGDWVLEANIGANPAYGDYRNVMIVKGRKGALIDLVAKTDAWTDSPTFAAPSLVQPDNSIGDPDPSQIPILSQWLKDYIQAAIDLGNPPAPPASDGSGNTEAAAPAASQEGEPDEYFVDFAKLATDEEWTGILVLRARVGRFPKDLAGLVAGIDNTKFEAHHLGVRISPVDGQTIGIAGTSSVFGLINYTDAGYDPTQGETPIAPTGSDTYSFLVLRLRALFENTAVKLFSSLAQLVVNKLFGVPVTGMVEGNEYQANPYQAILLDGAYQNSGGVSSYSLGTRTTNAFILDSHVLRRVAVTSAALTTVSSTGSAGRSVFGLTGCLDFAMFTKEPPDDGDGQSATPDEQPNEPTGGTSLVTGAEPVPLPFDIFSFGSASPDDPVTGLAFSRLQLPMTYDQSVTPPTSSITFDASAIAFVPSVARSGSVYTDFGPQLDGLIAAPAGKSPEDLGFQSVIVGTRIEGVGSEGWYALVFKLDLGTPGALAGKLGLTARLLLGWGPGGKGEDGGADASVGISLPGMGPGGTVFSVQSVLKIGIGRVVLDRGPVSAPDRARFLLTLNDIGLKVLGILKLPPSGVTNFLLFGAPNAAANPGSLGWLAMYNQVLADKGGADKQNSGKQD
jgi:hypothetical protein